MLRRAGVLADGKVAAVEVVASDDHMVSQAFRLRLRYAGGAQGPGRVFLKVPIGERPTVPGSRLPKEIAFYTQVPASGLPGRVPRCFEAHWDAVTGRSHLLLEDLADSHVQPTEWPVAPALAECERMVRALAELHAAWWQDVRLGVQVGQRPDAVAMAGWGARFAAQVDRFCSESGDWLSAERRAFLRRLAEAAPRVFAYANRRPLTLVHGDAHAWNCFLAKDPAAARDVWFDWDNWRVDVGAADLAYFMALQWFPERRRRFEAHMLDLYCDALAANGVAGYGRAELQEDYRLAVLWQVATPVKQYCGGLPPLAWWNGLERILLAVDDLGCAELL